MMIEVVKMLYFRLCVTVEYACVQFSELNATETKRPKAHWHLCNNFVFMQVLC